MMQTQTGAMRFDGVKSHSLNFRVMPGFKLALKAVADLE